MKKPHRQYDGLITIAVKVKARDITEALRLLDKNPLVFEFRQQDIEITSERHEIYQKGEC